jgi:hypothetical protein
MVTSSDERRARDVEQELARWHASFPAELVRDHIAALKHEREALAVKIAQLEEEYARWESFKTPRANGGMTALEAMQRVTRSLGEIGEIRDLGDPKRPAILELLAAKGKPMTTSDIRAALITRRLINEDTKGRKLVDATLFHMTRRGEIERVEKGVYKLPDGGEGEPAITGVQSR